MMAHQRLQELDEDWRSDGRPSLTSETDMLTADADGAELTSAVDWISQKGRSAPTSRGGGPESRASSTRNRHASGLSTGMQSRLGSLRRGVASVRRRVGHLRAGTMAGEGVCWCLVRILLPLGFIIGCSLQFDVISLVYLALLLACPVVPAPTRRSWQGPLGIYLKICLALTLLAILPLVCFQIALFAMPPYGHILQFCDPPEPLLRQLGLIRLDEVSILAGVFYFAAKLVPFVITLVAFRECRDLSRDAGVPETNAIGGGTSPLIQNTREQLQKDGLKYCFVTALTFLALAGAAVIRPSVTSAVYLLTLMAAMTWWACLRPLGRPFGVICRLLMAYTALHVTALYVYQFQWPQQYFDHTSLAARLAGLVQIKVANCTGDPRDTVFADTTWDVYIYPLVIYALYYMLAFESRILGNLRIAGQGTAPRAVTSSHDRTPLVEADSLGARYQAVGDGSCPDDATEEPAETRLRRERWQKFSATVYTVWRSLARASFLATYVVMMYWSIKYHSYLTFVFLLWALVVAVIKNQRKVMHRSSPFLVTYAQLLVLLQFVYCLDLTDQELPVKINNFDLRDVVYKPASFPCETLSLQLVFTTIFWLTLRQYLQEERERHNDLHLTPRRRLSLDDGLLKRWGVVLFKGIVRLWIVVVAIMLFVYGIGEERVVIIQIFYMAFFLFFISMFQISFRVWRRLLYGFTMTLILYQMLVLVTIYLYQFKHIHEWITDLGISQQWQRDLGLEVYQTGRLFIKLLFPTLFMIVCVVYIQHIHKDFMALTDEERYHRRPEPAGAPASQPASAAASPAGSPTGEPPDSPSPVPVFSPSADTINNTVDTVDTADTADTDRTADTVQLAGAAPVAEPEEEEMGVLPGGLLEVPTTEHGPALDETSSLREMKGWLFHYCARAWNLAVALLDKLLWVFCRLMEIHGMKVNMFAITMVTVFDVCAVHFCLLLLVCVALLLESRGQKVCCDLAICWVSLLLLLRMIYQMDVIPGDLWTVNCTFSMPHLAPAKGAAAPAAALLLNTTHNTTVHGLVWFGLQKMDSLPQYVTGYIGVILVLTLHKSVSVRALYRCLRDGHAPTEGVFFAGVGRAHSDRGLFEMTKYLVNYCFYKFGVEITLIALVILVGVRLDVVSVLYALWLCGLFSLRRPALARVWPVFVVFAAVLTPLQYLLALGLPAGLCYEYPYASVMNPELRQWLYLPDYKDPPVAQKLVADFFLLLLACCQRRVFSREECEQVRQLAGSNRQIDEQKLSSGYVIGVPDYITRKGTYLDVLKRVVFFSSYWLTLAVVFLAGINRITLLSLLYVASAFIFLWKGTDYYLLPFRDIRKRWILLLTYCVVVITLKCSIFQIMGCVFLPFFIDHACWFVQLMGIGCLQRLEPGLRPITEPASSSECPVPHSEAGLLWDGIVFACLLLQLRFFSSHYFQHLVLETRAQQMLASSGAEMIERERKKKIEKRQAEEEKAMADIRRKMERIKEQRIQKHRQKYDNHYQDLELDLERELEEPPPELAPPSDDTSREISPGQLLLSGIMKDFSSAAEDARKARRRSGEEQLSALGGESRGGVRRRGTLQRAKSHQAPVRQGSPRARLTRLHSDPAPRTHSLPISSLATLQSQDSQDDDDAPVAPHDGRDTNYSDSSEEEEGAGQKALASLLRRTILGLKSAGNFLLEFMASILIALTVKLNNVSADYRYIAKKLSKQKRRLKESWERPSESSPLAPPSGGGGGGGRPAVADPGGGGDTPLLYLTPEDTPRLTDPARKTGTEPFSDGSEDVEEGVRQSVSEDLSTASARQILEQLAVALWYAVVSRSEMVAYIVVFINQMVSASILSLPLPMMVFFWGSLSVPRPSKTFWVTMIAYTETIIIIKYMFQFAFFPWNQVEKLNAPFWPPRILGIERKDQYAVYDLVLLLIIFFHRVVMKTLGLWKDVDDVAELETPPVVPPADHLGATRLTVAERSRAVARKAKGELMEGFKFYVSAVGEFFKSLLSNSGKEKVDVYAYMFICDFINIFVVFLGFSSFGPPQGGSGDDISSVVEENRVPIPFLIILSLNFLLILVDRALYLRKTALWKLVFQYVLVVVVHGWLFFVLPAMTDREFDQAVAPRVWYMIKCIYLLFSAYQIRSGYPTRILGNFLTKQYTFFNKMAFRGFMLIPFLYELRALMDWMWTKTSLDIFNWLKMEDIYAHIFLIKCQRVQEGTQVYVSGEPRRTTEKCVFGGGWLLLIVAVIFAPLVLFALSNAVGLPNVPYEVTMEIGVGAYEPIFRMTAEQNSILRITEKDLDDISFHYRSDRRALGFLADYDHTDVNVIQLSGKSTAVWAISPPSQTRLIEDLMGNDTVTLKLAWNVKRLSNSAAVSTDSLDSRKIPLPAYIKNNVRNPIRQQLAAMLRGDIPGANVSIPHMFPKFIRVTNQGKAGLASELTEPTRSDPDSAWRALNLTLMRDNETEVEWWEVQEDCRDNLYRWLPYATCSLLVMVSFSQRSFPSTLTYITGAGIIGSYTTFVLVIGRLCRTPFVDISYHIMFDELPYVDRILQICEDIYLVRERGNLALEEELFAKLIFLYRSPEMMIKYTEPPREDSHSQ
ncbi:piezo-type mechanosensitive ion channel component-like isoform X1 [Amphibalanus amphitrite]|uniref:piezo-type mechanosensitive ion channel component-like isoform X1 n=1 Tax=Amphibalanus amphitrite TaxID=1232801 RepID=UPI001C911CBE|nr:piezo-type mechanosensitive ion channel component-like isoform X1 [Amphibalanus amphitrite]